MPSAPPKSPASNTTLSRGEACPGDLVGGVPFDGPVVVAEDERREIDLD